MDCFQYLGDQGAFSGETLNKKERKAKEREEIWRAALEREEMLLKQELSQHSDILLVNAVEVYRNLPHKTLQFYEW